MVMAIKTYHFDGRQTVAAAGISAVEKRICQI